jgi:hypothetical protein
LKKKRGRGSLNLTYRGVTRHAWIDIHDWVAIALTLVVVIAELLGMTQEQIQEQRQAGKSLAQIAATMNIMENALIDYHG